MNLATELKAVTDGLRKQAPAEIFSAIDAATAKLAATGLAGKALKRLAPETALGWLDHTDR